MSLSLFLFLAFLSVYFLIHSSFFDVSEVTVRGNRVVLTGEVKALSGIIPGTNIFEVNTTEATNAVKRHPMVKEAHIVRHLPDRIEIKVVERKPWAVVPAGSSFAVIDDCGVCIDRSVSLENIQCPVITLDQLTDCISPGQKLSPQVIKEIRNIISHLSPEVLAEISEFHYARNKQVYIYTLKGTEIRFGNQDRLQEKITLIHDVLEMEHELGLGEALAYVDLRFSGQPVVKFKNR